MTCFHPLKGYKARLANPKTGRRSIVFNRREGYSDLPLTIPCGQCIGCRLERSRQWAIRCMHEAQLYEDNCFLTLTYSDLPANKSVDVREFQLFIKKLRKSLEPKKIRFYHCGEYGEKFGRPHYHAIIFNHDFPDKIPWKISNENQLYTSEKLEEIWGKGFTSIGDVTFQSAAYVARYIMKKITGEAAEKHYELVDLETGEINQRHPEYTTMSRRPGIGKGWLDKYKSDVYPSDQVIMNGHPMRPPKYYDRQMEELHEKQFKRVRGKRIRAAKSHTGNQTPDRLKVREIVQLSKLEQLKRKVE